MAGLAAGAVLLATACTAVNQADQAEPAAAGPVTNGGILVAAQTSDADPGSFLKTSIGNVLVEYAVLETLTLIDTQTGEPKGVLATSWALAPDGLGMDIQLRDDATFHSGRTLTASDVVFTLQKVQDPAVGAANQAIAAQITAATATGEHALTLTFAKPLPNIFDLFETMPILNKDSYADYAAGQNVDGTGRFVWDSWTPNGKIRLSKYAGHRDAANTPLDGIEIDVIKDPTALVSAVRSGRTQYGFGMAALDARTLSEQPGYELVTSGGAAIPLSFDVTKAPFDNQTVRQAVQYAIDRDRIVAQVYGGQAEATGLPWRRSTAGYDSQQGVQYTYQPDKARQMLAEAGVAAGTAVQMVTLNTPEATGVFQIVQNNLQEVGLVVEPVVLAATDYDARIAVRDMGTPATQMLSSNALSPASAVVSRPELLSENNLSHFQSPEYTRLVQAITDAATTDAQALALREFNTYFLDQAFCLPVVTRPTLSVRSESVNGITPTQMGFIDLGQAWVSA
jgi:peptide/nickel transport system substrate-binding protein